MLISVYEVYRYFTNRIITKNFTITFSAYVNRVSTNQSEFTKYTHTMEDDGFTLVTKKRGFRKGKAKSQKGYSPHELSANSTEEQILASIEKCRVELRESAFIKEIDSIVRCLQVELQPVDIVCYGIGKIDSLYSQAPKYQLAAVLYLREVLKIPNTYFYDPVLTELEINALQTYQITDIGTNEEGKRKVGVKTLFLMFHVEQFLFENLIETNLDNLDKVLIMGNDMREMLCLKYRHMLDYIETIKVANSFHKDGVFDCCSLQWFVV